MTCLLDNVHILKERLHVGHLKELKGESTLKYFQCTSNNVVTLLHLHFGIPNSRLRYYLLAKRRPLRFCFPTRNEVNRLQTTYVGFNHHGDIFKNTKIDIRTLVFHIKATYGILQQGLTEIVEQTHLWLCDRTQSTQVSRYNSALATSRLCFSITSILTRSAHSYIANMSTGDTS